MPPSHTFVFRPTFRRSILITSPWEGSQGRANVIRASDHGRGLEQRNAGHPVVDGVRGRDEKSRLFRTG
jgi:hypothetical protein